MMSSGRNCARPGKVEIEKTALAPLAPEDAEVRHIGGTPTQAGGDRQRQMPVLVPALAKANPRGTLSET